MAALNSRQILAFISTLPPLGSRGRAEKKSDLTSSQPLPPPSSLPSLAAVWPLRLPPPATAAVVPTPAPRRLERPAPPVRKAATQDSDGDVIFVGERVAAPTPAAKEVQNPKPGQLFFMKTKANTHAAPNRLFQTRLGRESKSAPALRYVFGSGCLKANSLWSSYTPEQASQQYKESFYERLLRRYPYPVGSSEPRKYRLEEELEHVSTRTATTSTSATSDRASDFGGEGGSSGPLENLASAAAAVSEDPLFGPHPERFFCDRKNCEPIRHELVCVRFFDMHPDPPPQRLLQVVPFVNIPSSLSFDFFNDENKSASPQHGVPANSSNATKRKRSTNDSKGVTDMPPPKKRSPAKTSRNPHRQLAALRTDDESTAEEEEEEQEKAQRKRRPTKQDDGDADWIPTTLMTTRKQKHRHDQKMSQQQQQEQQLKQKQKQKEQHLKRMKTTEPSRWILSNIGSPLNIPAVDSSSESTASPKRSGDVDDSDSRGDKQMRGASWEQLSATDQALLTAVTAKNKQVQDLGIESDDDEGDESDMKSEAKLMRPWSDHVPMSHTAYKGSWLDGRHTSKEFDPLSHMSQFEDGLTLEYPKWHDVGFTTIDHFLSAEESLRLCQQLLDSARNDARTYTSVEHCHTLHPKRRNVLEQAFRITQWFHTVDMDSKEAETATLLWALHQRLRLCLEKASTSTTTEAHSAWLRNELHTSPEKDCVYRVVNLSWHMHRQPTAEEETLASITFPYTDAQLQQREHEASKTICFDASVRDPKHETPRLCMSTHVRIPRMLSRTQSKSETHPPPTTTAAAAAAAAAAASDKDEKHEHASDAMDTAVSETDMLFVRSIQLFWLGGTADINREFSVDEVAHSWTHPLRHCFPRAEATTTKAAAAAAKGTAGDKSQPFGSDFGMGDSLNKHYWVAQSHSACSIGPIGSTCNLVHDLVLSLRESTNLPHNFLTNDSFSRFGTHGVLAIVKYAPDRDALTPQLLRS